MVRHATPVDPIAMPARRVIVRAKAAMPVPAAMAMLPAVMPALIVRAVHRAATAIGHRVPIIATVAIATVADRPGRLTRAVRAAIVPAARCASTEPHVPLPASSRRLAFGKMGGDDHRRVPI